MSEQLVDHLDRVTPERMAELSVPGAALAIVSGDAITHVRCYGVTDVEREGPVTADTRS